MDSKIKAERRLCLKKIVNMQSLMATRTNYVFFEKDAAVLSSDNRDTKKLLNLQNKHPPVLERASAASEFSSSIV